MSITDLTWLEVTLAALCVYRCAMLLSKEDGPFKVFKWLRRNAPDEGDLDEGIQCLWCSSVWVAFFVGAFMWSRPILPPLLVTTGEYFILFTALSAIAMCVNQTFTKGD